MRFKFKPYGDRYKKHKWFAWHPIRIPPETINHSVKVVWLEVVYRKKRVNWSYGVASWEYYLPEEE